MSNENNGTSLMVQGRIVWKVGGGDLFKGSPKLDYNTKQPKIGKDGLPMIDYGFGLAVPKVAQGQPGYENFMNIWNAVHKEAYAIYPSGHLPPGFAMKFKDGDTGVDDKGIPLSTRKGYAGNLVFSCTTTIPIKWFRWENNQNIQINEGIKCGDYVNVMLTVKAHPAQGTFKPGIYLNPNAVQFLQFGEEIVNTPSGDQMFGAQAPVPVIQGGSNVPFAPQSGAPFAPSPTAAPVPQQAPQPHYGVLPGQFQPQAAPVPQQVPVPGNGYGSTPSPVPAAVPTPQYGSPTGVPTPAFGAAPGAYPSSAPAPVGFPMPPR